MRRHLIHKNNISISKKGKSHQWWAHTDELTDSSLNLEKTLQVERRQMQFWTTTNECPVEGTGSVHSHVTMTAILSHKHTPGGNMSRKTRIITESSCKKKIIPLKMQWCLQPRYCTDCINSCNLFQKSKGWEHIPAHRPSWELVLQKLSSANQESLLTSNKITEESKSYKIALPNFIDAVACASQSRVMLLWTTLFSLFFPTCLAKDTKGNKA